MPGELMVHYAAGVLAMAALTAVAVEATKLLLPLRAFFHRRAIEAWIRGGMQFQTIEEQDKLVAEFLELLAASDKEQGASGLLEQPAPKLLASVQSFAANVLDAPQNYHSFYAFFCSFSQKSAQPAPVSATDEAPPAKPASDCDVWAEFAQDRASGLSPNPEKETKAMQARDRLERWVERKLDALQADIQFRWERAHRVASLAFGILLVLISVYAEKQVTVNTLFTALVTGLVAIVFDEILRRALTEREQ